MLQTLLGRRKNRSSFIFVVGCGHTGTTLAAALLGAHSRIYSIPYETAAFFRSWSTGSARRKLEAAALECDKPEAQYICEMTPRHVYHVARISRAYPGSRFVVCLRNPLDTVASLKRRKGSLDVAIGRWRDENTAAKELLARSDCFVLRYESLIEGPEDTVAALCRFLGIDYEPAMFNFWKDDREWQGAKARIETDGKQGANHKALRNWQIHQPLMKDRIGRYRSILTDDEIGEVGRQLAPLASELGYEITAEPAARRSDSTLGAGS